MRWPSRKFAASTLAATIVLLAGCGNDSPATVQSEAGRAAPPAAELGEDRSGQVPAPEPAPTSEEGGPVNETRPSEPAIMPLGDESAVGIPGSEIQVTVPRFAAFAEYETISTTGENRTTISGVRFRVPGPVEGSMSASAAVVVSESTDPVTDVASLLDAGREHQELQLGDTSVVYWPEVERIESGVENLPARVVSRYAWQSSDQEVVQVTFDGLEGEAAEDYVTSLAEGWQS